MAVVQLEQLQSPQLEDGHTRIANELLDALIRFDFSKRQYKVVLFVIRKTYGWNKKADVMSLSQIVDGTGLFRTHCCATVNELSDMKVLLKQAHQHGQLIKLNKNYGEWKLLPKQSQCDQNSNEVLPKQSSSVTKTGTTKDKPKNNTKDITYASGVFVVSDEAMEVFKSAYSDRDIQAEIKKAGAWCFSNPSKAPKSNYKRFINGWLSRATPSEPRTEWVNK